jgi:hypothetical protein
MTDIAFRTRVSPGPRTGEVRSLADDILRGADQIAAFVFGNPGERRKIYHLAEKSRLPVFRLGSVLCARKSTILGWVAEQESRATGADR